MRIGDALRGAHVRGIARLDAQLLLAHLLQQRREWLLAHDETELPAARLDAWQSLLERRTAGEPLAYLVGAREFHGLALQVSPAVLVPRPETELLVDWALQRLADAPAATLIDLGTGSGAVALAVKHRLPLVDVTASDASEAALEVARVNAERHALRIEFVRGDWWQAVGDRRFGLAVSNPPYVAGDDPHLMSLAHEPRAALTPEGDGLAAIRQLVADAPAHLLPGAWLLLEHGHDQACAVQALLRERGFGTPETRHDLAAFPRCTGARWPAD
jgi:release factor glutamine methyltransferase